MCASDQIRFEPTHAGLQRLTARFGGHAYDLHRHETYAVGLTLWGAQSFHYRGELRTSAAGQVMVIHPDEARLVTQARIGCGAMVLSALMVVGGAAWALLNWYFGTEGLG